MKCPLAGVRRRPCRQGAPAAAGPLAGHEHADALGADAPLIAEQVGAQKRDAEPIAGDGESRGGVRPGSDHELHVAPGALEHGVILKHPREQNVVPAGDHLDRRGHGATPAA